MTEQPNNSKAVPHRWAEVIKAWADGKEIQGYSTCNDDWLDWTDESRTPDFNSPTREWRVKPEQKTGWIAIKPVNGTENSQTMVAYCTHIYTTKEEALDYYMDKSVAVIQITYTEGEGL